LVNAVKVLETSCNTLTVSSLPACYSEHLHMAVDQLGACWRSPRLAWTVDMRLSNFIRYQMGSLHRPSGGLHLAMPLYLVKCNDLDSCMGCISSCLVHMAGILMYRPVSPSRNWFPTTMNKPVGPWHASRLYLLKIDFVTPMDGLNDRNQVRQWTQ
jgi:hypothetical protein